MNGAISPIALTLIQHTFVDDLGGAFVKISALAERLFYIVAAIELALFGLVWALRQQELLGTFLLKVLKLGFIFTVITLYPQLLQALIDGFSQAALLVVPGAAKFLFNPAQIWSYGFDTGISMLSLSVQYGTSNIGVSIIYILMGFGILLLFALMGAEIILVVVAFYVVSLLALLLIPLGAFNPTRNLFEKAIQSVFAAGARVYTLVIILGVAVSVWGQFPTGAISKTTTIDIPLGMLFVTMVFWVLMVKLPGIAVRSVGELGGSLLKESGAAIPAVSVHVATPGVASNHLSQMTAASAIMPNTIAGSSLSNVASGSQVAGGIGEGRSVQGGVTLSNASNIGKTGESRVQEGSHIGRGISSQTLNKLKATFRQVLNEKNPK